MSPVINYRTSGDNHIQPDNKQRDIESVTSSPRVDEREISRNIAKTVRQFENAEPAPVKKFNMTTNEPVEKLYPKI